jgi:hypothetical protein
MFTQIPKHINLEIDENQTLYVKNQVSAEERCNMTADYGRCQGNQLRWHFDRKSQHCHSFLYSGCGGNANRFESYQACASICKEAPRTPKTTTPEPYQLTTLRTNDTGVELMTGENHEFLPPPIRYMFDTLDALTNSASFKTKQMLLNLKYQDIAF